MVFGGLYYNLIMNNVVSHGKLGVIIRPEALKDPSCSRSIRVPFLSPKNFILS